jgi:hypothetical protein
MLLICLYFNRLKIFCSVFPDVFFILSFYKLQYVVPVYCAQCASWVYVCTVEYACVCLCECIISLGCNFWIFWLWFLLLWMSGPQCHFKMCYTVLHLYFKFIGTYVLAM